MGAYVIPLVDIIEDIRSRFSEVSIQFPSDSLLHLRDEAMKPSLTRGSAVPWEDTHHAIASSYNRRLYGSDSMEEASTIDGTEPPGSVFSQPISIATAASSSMDPWENPFKSKASEFFARSAGIHSASIASSAPRASRPARWKTSGLRKMARLYTYTTLSLSKIIEVVYSDLADPMPG